MSGLYSLEDQVIIALRRITRAIDLHSRGLMQRFGLTVPQLAALQAVGRLQPVTIGALAKSIHLSQATLTGILARLEKQALITRTRSGADRRAVFVELSDSGRALLEDAPSLLQDRFRRRLHDLQEWEQTQLLASLQRIAALMDAPPDVEGVADVSSADFSAVEVPPAPGPRPSEALSPDVEFDASGPAAHAAAGPEFALPGDSRL